MRRIAAILILFAAPGVSLRAEAQTNAAPLETCVAAAGTSRVQLEACRGVMLEPCLETPGGVTTLGMMQCFAAEAEAWQALLDGAHTRTLADASRSALSTQAQEAWAAWRDAECRYRASLYAGGSLARVLAASCLNDLTADRAIELIYAERNPE